MAASNPPTARDVAAALHGTLTSLEEQLSVLRILDNAAASWPGVSSCMKAMQAAASCAAARLVEESEQWQRAEQECQQARAQASVFEQRSTVLERERKQAQQRARSQGEEVSKLKKQLNATEEEADSTQKHLYQQVRTPSLQNYQAIA
jgi:chromosome segregation ATPase